MSAAYYQEVELKLKYSDEDSDDTYMGLTEQDYNSDSYSRYSASQKDNMSTEHMQVQINHLIDLSGKFSLGTSVYHNDFSRNWYKTSKVNDDSLGKGGIEVAAAYDKTVNSSPLEIDVKANNRSYLSQGIQTVLNADFNAHQLKFGLRFHKDEMDRYQWVDGYELDANYQMNLVKEGVAGTDSNRIDSAEAVALFVHDEWTVGDLVVNAGLRYEDMKIERKDWGKSDPARLDNPKHKINKLDVVLPSLAFTYRITDDAILLGGVQKGFAPPAPGNEEATNEESINYEFGVRYNKNNLELESILFLSDYDNMHGNCTASQNCSDENIGDQYNAGEVQVSGIEVKAEYSVDFGTINMPINFTYTRSVSEFLNTFESDFWGDVASGDEFPYVPENQFQFVIGLEGQQWQSNLLIRYSGEMRTTAGLGEIDDGIDAHTVVDFVANYDLTQNQQVSLTVDNLLDETYMASRTHGSIMVGKPLTVSLGYKYSF